MEHCIDCECGNYLPEDHRSGKECAFLRARHLLISKGRYLHKIKPKHNGN
jgi:hypothetical protein